MKKLIAITLVVVMIMSVMACSLTTFSAASGVTLQYVFSGANATDAGFAQGNINLKVSDSASAGNYYLYWADGTKALDGYRQIATLNVANGSTGTYKMLENTAIPKKATQIIAIKSSSTPANKNVSSAAATYPIPNSKRLPSSDALYSFGAISDPQLANDSYGSGSYPNDETHLAAAFETLAKRGVDFTVSSGDTVNDQNGNQTLAAEYKRYQKILADSSYVNPIYEANGNHDVGVVWKGTSSNNDKPFIMGTGLDSNINTIKAGKPYFEVTEPTTGDHFIFMALEGSFYTDENTQFSKAQLDWLEGLLKKYKDDGKNIFIVEHANIQGWGSGDKLTTPYYYDLGLNRNAADVKRFISLMQTYKECVMITGHTHLELGAHLNYSDNNDTSAVMMHNSAIGGVRRLVNGTIDRTAVLGMSEGYIVDVYSDCIIFNGTNMYHNEIMPDCTYIIPFTTTANPEAPTEAPTSAPTQKPTQAPTTAPTVKPTTAPTEAPTQKPTQPPTVKPTDAPTEAPTQAPTEAEPNYGDTNLDGKVGVVDATLIQRFVANIDDLDEQQRKNAEVSGDGKVSVVDATNIQRLVARIIDLFPVQTGENGVAATGAGDVATLLATAKADLSTYYTYSSFDQYQALKKVVKELTASSDKSQAAYDKLNKAYTDFWAILEALGVATGDTIDVYFTNIPNWSTVNAYAWAGSGSPKNAEWPGEAMDFVETNSMNQKVYKITLETGKYNNIIFNNGSAQTVDLVLSNINNEGFYTTTQSGGKYLCDTYVYGE